MRDITRKLGRLKQICKGIPILSQAYQITLFDPMAKVTTVKTGTDCPHLINVEAAHPMPLLTKLQIGHFDFSFKKNGQHGMAGGHLKATAVLYTAEIELRPTVGGAIGRKFDPETGTGFWAFKE